MKSKRVLTILLSLAIMLTFMPSMAFAADSDPHNWQDDAAKTIAATCQHDGILVQSCTGETFPKGPNGEPLYDDPHAITLPCEAIKTTYLDILTECTPKANPIQLSKADYLVRLATEHGDEFTPADIQELAESNTACYVFVKECKDCGRVIPDTAEWEGHKKPAGTADCALSYVCEFCGQTVRTGKHSANEGQQYISQHKYGEEKLVGENFCSDGTPNGGYNVYERTCADCGDVYRIYRNANGSPYTWGATGVKHEKLVEEILYPASCTEQGLSVMKCAECGNYDWSTVKTLPRTGHKWATVSVPATCTTRAYTIEMCQNPNCPATKHTDYTGDPLGHDYVVKVLTEPNCDAPGITQIYCSRCNAVGRAKAGFADLAYAKGFIKNVDKDGYILTNGPTKDSKLYLVGLTNEFVDKAHPDKITSAAIEIKDWKKGKHDWGQYESMTVADCTHGGFQAKKCKICGHFDPHTAKETGDAAGHKWVTVSQEPTCGAKGFTVQRCAVCGEQNGPVVRWGEPKVSYGAKCDFSEWVVETEPTPFKEGTKKLICSKCGDDGHLALVNGEVKEVGVTRANIAKTKIAAPKVKAGKKKAVVTVKAVEGAVKYQIKVNGKVKKTVTKAGKVTIKKLKGGKKAKFQIVAINDKGVKAASKVKTVKIKK